MYFRHVRAIYLILFVLILGIPFSSGLTASASPGLQTTPEATPSARSTTPTPASTLLTATITSLAERNYEVKAGDTLWSIAAKFYGNGALYILIQQANGLSDHAVLSVGSNLVIPPANQATSLPTTTPTATEHFSPSPIALTQRTESTSTPPVQTLNASAVPTTLPLPVSQTSSTPIVVGSEWAPLIPYLRLATFIISGFCFLGSGLCAYLSFESYRHSQPYVRRRRIGRRIREGL